MSDTPATPTKQQIEAGRFRSAVSESLIQKMQGNLNYLLGAILPIGTIIDSMLTEAQFQDIMGTKWVLCDGRNIATSDYAVLTGNTLAPDLRGRFRRMKDHASGHNTGGDLALGAYQADEAGPHNHIQAYGSDTGVNPDFGRSGTYPSGGWGIALQAANVGNNPYTGNGSGLETRPRNITVNSFMRINN